MQDIEYFQVSKLCRCKFSNLNPMCKSSINSCIKCISLIIYNNLSSMLLSIDYSKNKLLIYKTSRNLLRYMLSIN